MKVEPGSRPIPNRLKLHRKRMRYKQRHVAKLLGLHGTRPIYLWEKGLAMPSAENLLKLSAIYHTIPNELYYEYYAALREEIKALELSVFADHTER